MCLPRPYCVDSELHANATRLLTYTMLAFEELGDNVGITKARNMSRSASLNNLFRTTLLMILHKTIDPVRIAKMTSGITIAFRRLSMTVAGVH